MGATSSPNPLHAYSHLNFSTLHMLWLAIILIALSVENFHGSP